MWTKSLLNVSIFRLIQQFNALLRFRLYLIISILLAFCFDTVLLTTIFCCPEGGNRISIFSFGHKFETFGDYVYMCSMNIEISFVWPQIMARWVTSMESSAATLMIFEKGSLIARFMGLTWGPSRADRTHVGPMLAPWTLLSGVFRLSFIFWQCSSNSFMLILRWKLWNM